MERLTPPKRTIISVDVTKKPHDQPVPLHNRWHPDIPMVASVKPGEVVRIECLDWTGGQIKDNNSAEDIKKVDLTQVHYLSGPVRVESASPGDLLVVHILDIGPLAGFEWGFTGIFARENGGGFLTDHYPHASKAIWHFEGIYAVSRHIPGVRIPGIIHPGLFGCLPSTPVLENWNKREKDLVQQDPHRVPPLAELPNPQGALLGNIPRGSALWEKAVLEACRTIPPREHGGNCDIKNLSKGSIAYLPVYVEGAGFSIGDLHFSQGDGEISFCGAIEMAGWVDVKFEVIKGGIKSYGIKNPIFKPSPVEPKFSSYLVFEGISVDEKGTQYYLDATIAYKNACLNAIEYLKKFGYTGEQAYLLLGAAPVEGRISGIVDIPNACATLAIPTEIFQFNIMPTEEGPHVEVTPNK